MRKGNKQPDERAEFECMYDRLDTEVSDDLCREDAWVIWQKARATQQATTGEQRLNGPICRENTEDEVEHV